ncbi:hypothetical protein [Lunatibacter salilacus]|uniref:hypothetical protein n=1 Tax=Lunatibacter salilacus TaxID=2483804 RepID=UPI00131BBC66|nr:hypothetical protein [Lunatibacter salilacus]
MSKQVPVLLEGELVVPFSQLNPVELSFFRGMLGESDIKCIRLTSKNVEKTIPYPIYTYWVDYLHLAKDQPNAIQEV